MTTGSPGVVRCRDAPFRSERNLVVEVAAAAREAAAATAAAAAAAGARHRGLGIIVAARRAAAAARVEQLQLAAEVLQHDLGRVFLDARLIGVFAGLELALEIDLR